MFRASKLNYMRQGRHASWKWKSNRSHRLHLDRNNNTALGSSANRLEVGTYSLTEDVLLSVGHPTTD